MSNTDITGTAKVVFMPSGRRGDFPLGTTVLEASRALGVDLDTVCGGRAVCGRCQIVPSHGEFAKLQIVSEHNHLSESGPTEEKYKRIKGLKDGRRLGCQSQILGDMVIDVPEESQIHRQVVRKSADEIRDLEIDPVVTLHYVELPKPSMEDQRADLERIVAQLAQDWGLDGLAWDIQCLARLSPALRAGEAYGGEFKATVAVRGGREAIAVWPGFKDRVYGIAVDVGTTTVAGHLCALDTGEVLASSGMMNPQIRFGEDLMSRISYLQQNEGSAPELTSAVQAALADLVTVLAGEAGIDPQEVVELTIVGNPTMHHLVLGIDPTQLGMEPFPLVLDQGSSIRVRDLGLPVNPGGYAWFLPCIAGHVGADTAGVILSQAPHLTGEMTLVIDVGTNAEIVLGHKDRLIACSSPTGPAFEGAQITCGQRAAPGAIERVRIDRETLKPRFKVIGSDLWSDEPGFAEAIEGAGVTGICGSGIIEAVAELHLAGIVDASGRMQAKGLEIADHPNFRAKGRNFEYVLHTDDERAIYVAPGDVRAIQLAKSACYSGTRLLMDRMGTAQVDRIYLAGAFGSYIDVAYAMAIGLIPDCDLAQVASAGNAAGTGARIALLSAKARAEIDRVCRQVEKVETAIAEDFQEYFVAAMSLPHASDPFPQLEAWLEAEGLARR
ncbi:MAG: ASKHA domain-containing protein [Paracoccaceae bacterium]|nr:ASKHA domain-containing protein [Paracoccaceae bacterium]